MVRTAARIRSQPDSDAPPIKHLVTLTLSG
jgi:hypothetical protein